MAKMPRSLPPVMEKVNSWRSSGSLASSGAPIGVSTTLFSSTRRVPPTSTGGSFTSATLTVMVAVADSGGVPSSDTRTASV